MQQLKYILIIVTLAIVVFFSYFSMDIINHKHILLEKSEYNVKLQNIKNNPSAIFRNNGKSKFFIHPGEKKPTKAIFNFDDSILLKISFSLQKGAKHGNIKFIINKNNNTYQIVQIDAKENFSKNIYIYLSQGDKLEFLADKNGDTIYDWGNISIHKITFFSILNIILTPIMWLLLLLFMWYHNFLRIGMVSYVLFLVTIYAESLNFGRLNISLLSTYTLLYFSINFISISIYQFFNKFKISAMLHLLITLILLTIPLITIIYISIFDSKITQDILFALFQTNPRESIEFLKSFVDVKYFIFIIVFTLLLSILFYIQNIKNTHSLEKKLILFLVIVFSSLTWVHFNELTLLNMIHQSYHQYIEEVALFNDEKEKRKVSKLSFNASKENHKETYIVMIGESLSKHHMSLYGYLRNTTPTLKKLHVENKLTPFYETYSNHTVTTHTLSLALTEANQYNHKKYYDSISIVEILNKANFETYWLTAQPTHGAFQNLITVMATEADHFMPIDIHDAQNGLDGSLIYKVNKILEAPQKKNRVIFVHLMGSHYTYEKRYPKDTYSLFTGSLHLEGKLYKNNKINAYDNSVAYNDYVVSSILKSLQKKEGINGFIYLSDHAEDVLKNKAHNPSQFTFAMTQIPMITWFSPKYKLSYPQTYDTLMSHTHRIFSNDLLYDTLIGFMGIKTNKYSPEYDLSSIKYALEVEDALALHGRKKYIDKENTFYWKNK